MLFITIIVGMCLIYYGYTKKLEMKHKEKMKELENQSPNSKRKTVDEHVENEEKEEILNEVKSKREKDES